MNENVQEFIYNWIGIIMLTLSISLFLFIYLSINDMNNIIYKSENLDASLYENNININDKLISGDEIIFQIHKGLICDIEVAGKSIDKNTDPIEFDYTLINLEKRYKIKNKFDSRGIINKIIYY